MFTRLICVVVCFWLTLPNHANACVPTDIPYADQRLNKIKLTMRQSEVEKAIGERVSVKGDAALIFDAAARADRETKLMPGIIDFDASGRITTVAGRAANASREKALQWLTRYGQPLELTDASTLMRPRHKDFTSERFAVCVVHDITLEVVFVKRVFLAEPDIPYFKLTKHSDPGGCFKQLK